MQVMVGREVKEDTRTKVNERVAIFNIIVEDADVS